MDHRKAFIDTQKTYGVGPTALHKQTGIARPHISNFINSKGDLTTERLSKLVEGMEQLAPGSKKYYCQLLYGKKFLSTEQMVDSMDGEELAEIVTAIGLKLSSNAKHLMLS